MKQLLLTFLTIIIGLSLNAQDDLKMNNSIGLSIGYNSGYYKDVNFSPLNYLDRGIHIDLAYLRYSRNGKFISTLEMNYDDLSTQTAHFFSSNLIHAKLRLAYLFNVYQKDKLSFLIGPEFISDNQFVVFEGLNAFSFLFAHSLGLNLESNFQFNEKTSFLIGLHVPLLHQLARPPYNGFNKETEENAKNPINLITNGKLTSINDYLFIGMDFSYKRILSSRFELGFAYSLNFYKTFEQEDLILLQNQYKSTLNYKF